MRMKKYSHRHHWFPTQRIHYAWIVLGALTLIMIITSGLRSVFGVFIPPLESEFGWDRTSLSGVAALSLFLLGGVAPFVGRLADQWGPRRVIGLSLLALGVGTVASGFVTALWHLYLTAGILMAVGAGGIGMSTAAVIAARWFATRRGLVMGIASGAMSAGQLIIFPLATGLTLSLGWRESFLWLGVGLFVIAIPIAIWLIRDQPTGGLRPYGVKENRVDPKHHQSSERVARISVLMAASVPTFWLLAATFFVCGYTSGGLILTHFIVWSAGAGFSQMTAAKALGLMGGMNMLGTIVSGWLCDHFGRKVPLASYYFVRGISLLLLMFVDTTASLYLFAILFGLNYISTVPPTTIITANVFGARSVGELSGWIFLSHQVGAALGATFGGWLFDWSGSYTIAFFSGGVLAIIAAALTAAIQDRPIPQSIQPVPA